MAKPSGSRVLLAVLVLGMALAATSAYGDGEENTAAPRRENVQRGEEMPAPPRPAEPAPEPPQRKKQPAERPTPRRTSQPSKSKLPVWAGALEKGRAIVNAGKMTVKRALPDTLPPMARSYLQGAASVIFVLQFPPASTEAGSTLLKATTSHTTHKFLYSLGGISVELLLLSLLCCRRSPWRSTRSRYQRYVAHPIGWACLVALIAIPSGVIDVGLLLAVSARLPCDLYAPAMILGKLLRPYVYSAIMACPCINQQIQKVTHAAGKWFPKTTGVAQNNTAAVGGYVASALVVLSLLFLATAILAPEPEQEESKTGKSKMDLARN